MLSEEVIKEFKGEYRFLSNFWPSTVHLGDEKFPTVEHAYQAAKSVDSKDYERIRNSPTPGLARRIGRSITMKPNFDERKLPLMEYLVRQKFSSSCELRDRLLGTGDKVLQEGNTWGDTFWGVDLHTGRGQNNLGKILMRVRGELKG